MAICEARGVEASEAEWCRVRDAMMTLQSFPDVAPGLAALKTNGWNLVAFSNSSEAALKSGLEQAGVHGLFDAVLSVERAGTFKPALAAYECALEFAGVDRGRAVMVACHDWDLAGAAAVGMRS